ncbi:hypothetical protein D3C78_1911580 [compost metagenome]
MQPVLQFLVAVQLAELALDQLTLTRVDMPIGLGSSHQGLEDGLAVLLDLRRRQAI